MSEFPNGLQWEVKDHARRLEALERFELAVLVNRLSGIEKRMDGVIKAAWVVATSILVAVVTFALGIVSGAIGH